MCAFKIDTERVDWSRRYQMALSRYLKRRPPASLRTALNLGRQAVTLGLETLDVARLHEQALTGLAPVGDSSRATRRRTSQQAKRFFAEVIVPIEATHCSALNAEVDIDRLTRALRQRTRESSASATQLEQAIAERQAAEADLKKGTDDHASLLAQAQGMQKQLQDQMHGILSAQESERQEISHHLRDEIVQALIAIDLNLLTLKTSSGTDTKSLEKEIANAQRLVEQYVQEARRKEQQAPHDRGSKERE